jgi:hypothetical protein
MNGCQRCQIFAAIDVASSALNVPRTFNSCSSVRP